MLDRSKLGPIQGTASSINDAYRAPEYPYVSHLIEYGQLTTDQTQQIQNTAMSLIKQVQKLRLKSSGIDSFLTEYALSSDEGIALMCLAEALLRVPDTITIDSLIKDKLGSANWQSHRGQSHSTFVNATTWALMLTGKVLSPEKAESKLSQVLIKLIKKSGEGVVRKAVERAMRIMSRQFVMGRTIEEATKRAQTNESKGYSYSYDMLGEAALTERDAQRYMKAYEEAIISIGKVADPSKSLRENPGISVKLSAIHPRYEENQRKRVLDEIPPRLLRLAQLAKQYQIGLTVDAEESDRLMLSLDIFTKVYEDESLAGWHGLGLAVQSYQKRAFYVIDYIAELAKKHGRRVMLRLIKGAYWDTEIKRAQMDGQSGYPVFTRKIFTDVSFHACAKKLLTYTDYIYPQFATHNAYTVATVLTLVGDYTDYEFQCLHGMGVELYDQITPKNKLGIPCRIYAPVGSHEDLLPYLVRRLLENGANSSFVNRIVDQKSPIEKLAQDPLAISKNLIEQNKPFMVLPEEVFLPERKNSQGFDFTDREKIANLQRYYNDMTLCQWESKPLIAGPTNSSETFSVYAPFDNSTVIGKVTESSTDDIETALERAKNAHASWSNESVEHRAAVLDKIAELFENHRYDLMAINTFEAAKTWRDNIAEIREAIDFCYYYAQQARKLFGKPMVLPGYTGELDELSFHGRGVFVCISPWNFPLAIFTGQVVAALVTGNCVIAKPSEQTSLIASLATKLMHQAGIPTDVLQLLPGKGETVGAQLVNDTRIKGVVFTGSTQTASKINQTLAKRSDEIVPLIAETGGQNAMIVDSSALLEQVTKDVLLSAFGSAGQRCSALRVLYIQEEIYEKLMTMIQGAMAEITIGDPRFLDVDAGPVIDKEALDTLLRHVGQMKEKGRVVYQTPVSEECEHGYFMPPTLIKLDSINELSQEFFGPILHVIRYQKKNVDSVIHDINQTGYGLTMGIHTRINQFADYVRKRVHVGNCYVNRNMIGAVVGLQPFGGEGKSGTGFKAGGPLYLYRFCHERTYTVDTTAAGGNASLMAIPEDY
ncbi:bifunctional proline dehydrogenase/L-glutamate gamma-semialdehyde dehydrogenase PutA [Legionella sp. W05-934-2]|uniref:bifunctional proline dehydrogenase/L-glutamate gamma-semialdehyde dehydrogenase PutA n=1 Tax=Legionella sp. W05-934-2 TaxID=1198649 RepID=UPI0034632A8A